MGVLKAQQTIPTHSAGTVVTQPRVSLSSMNEVRSVLLVPVLSTTLLTRHAPPSKPHTQDPSTSHDPSLPSTSPPLPSASQPASSSSRPSSSAPAVAPPATSSAPVRLLSCAVSVAARGGLQPHEVRVKVDGGRGALGDVAVSGAYASLAYAVSNNGCQLNFGMDGLDNGFDGSAGVW